MLPLKADQTALLVLDCQNAIVHQDGLIARAMGFAEMIRAGSTLTSIAALMDEARQVGALVVHVRIDPSLRNAARAARRGHFFAAIAAMSQHGESPLAPGSWGAEFHERCQPLPGEPVVGKFPVGAFANSNLDQELSRRGISDLILAGVATHMVVESTTRQATDLGYSVVVASDACAAGSKEQHAASVAAQATFADILSAQEIIGLFRQQDQR
jgi:nicotinamidase-related amidase